eukprot:666603-Amphidinium_carterae.1
MEKVVETIEQWEREVCDYERVRKKALDEEIKIGVLAYLAPDKRGWLKANLDTGAAVSVMPQHWAVAQESAGGQKLRTASGRCRRRQAQRHSGVRTTSPDENAPY